MFQLSLARMYTSHSSSSSTLTLHVLVLQPKLGHDLVAIVPNITSEVMTELGLQYEDDGSIKQKSADYFFRSRPMKTLPGSGGACLRLGWNVNFKYTKVSSEL